MRVAVAGLWHLGCVTAACCARHFDVVGFDEDPENIERLRSGRAPLFEPGLDDLLKSGIDSGKLRFTTSFEEACKNADVLWVTFDTPVDGNDVADTEYVLSRIRQCIPLLPDRAIVLISSQLPAGTCGRLEQEFPDRKPRIACSPENLRLGKAIEIFSNPDRIIAGCRTDEDRELLKELFLPFSTNVVWMRPESAEMTKHAINAFLALSITFMNELSCLCERVGGDASEVEKGIKSEQRIGPKSYLSPGGAFAGGTLARDVMSCIELGESFGESLEIFPAIKRSNDHHRSWALRKIQELYPVPPAEKIGILGLTYKPGTDTLRRSSAVELAESLREAGFSVAAHDPSLKGLPEELGFIDFETDLPTMARGACILVVCTSWPAFRERDDWKSIIDGMHKPVIIDAARYLASQLGSLPGVTYSAVGIAL